MERLVVSIAMLLLSGCLCAAAWAVRSWNLGLDLHGLYWMTVSLVAGQVGSRLLRVQEAH